MAFASAPDLLVLHTLRLKGFVDADVVAAASGQPEAVVHAVLHRLAGAGHVVHRPGRITGWSLTASGRAEGERRLAAELDASGGRDAVAHAYRSFRALNPEFLLTCTRWQLRAADGLRVANDHHDPSYDDEVVAELDRIDESVQPVCRQLAATLHRFVYYNGRFAAARARVHLGDHDWFDKPMIDSYHSVWFELHENLLATLNIERASETPVAR